MGSLNDKQGFSSKKIEEAHMNYVQYLFSDKKAKLFWTVYYIIIISIALSGLFISFFTNTPAQPEEKIPFYSIIITSAIVLGFPIFYTFSFLNYRSQGKFKQKYGSLFKNDSTQTHVEITTSEKVKTPITNYQVKINNKTTDNYIVMHHNNAIVIFGQVSFLGVLRHHLKPIIVSLDKGEIQERYDYAIVPKQYTLHENSNLTINFLNSNIGIETLTLIDWGNYSNKLNAGAFEMPDR